jgi:hypothetical protein
MTNEQNKMIEDIRNVVANARKLGLTENQISEATKSVPSQGISASATSGPTALAGNLPDPPPDSPPGAEILAGHSSNPKK